MNIARTAVDMFVEAEALYFGKGIPKNEQKAVELLTNCSWQGMPEAQHILSYIIRTDDRFAFHGDWLGLLVSSANSGFPIAQFELGLAYLNGDRVEPSIEKAVAWFERAATQGIAAASIMLGAMYLMGDGVPQDIDAALVWLNKESVKGHEAAIKLRSAAEEMKQMQSAILQ